MWCGLASLTDTLQPCLSNTLELYSKGGDESYIDENPCSRGQKCRFYLHAASAAGPIIKQHLVTGIPAAWLQGTPDINFILQAIEDQINNFGQTPSQLFRKRHGKRGPPPAPTVHPLLNGPDAMKLAVVGRPPTRRCRCIQTSKLDFNSKES